MSRCSIKSKEFKQRLYEREVEQRLQEEQRQRDKKLEDEKRKFQETVDITKDQSGYWHKMDIIRRLVLNLIFLVIHK